MSTSRPSSTEADRRSSGRLNHTLAWTAPVVTVLLVAVTAGQRARPPRGAPQEPPDKRITATIVVSEERPMPYLFRAGVFNYSPTVPDYVQEKFLRELRPGSV